MGIETRFRHTLTIEHRIIGASDAWGHAEVTFSDETGVPGLVQERTGREINGPKLGGTVIADALIFLAGDTDVAEEDRILHGERAYEVLYVKDAAGLGHHLEVDARSVRAGVEVGS